MVLVRTGATRTLVGFITPVEGRDWQRGGVYVRNVCVAVVTFCVLLLITEVAGMWR